jgi:hypothetical protein
MLDGGITNIRVVGGAEDPERNAWIQADPSLAPYVWPNMAMLEYAQALWSARITLSTTVIGPNPVISPSGYWSSRLPSAMLAGSMVLTDMQESVTTAWDVGGVPRQMVDGVHLVTYDSYDDAVEKARYYLAHEDERRAIAAAGCAFAKIHLTEREVVGDVILPALEAIRGGSA